MDLLNKIKRVSDWLELRTTYKFIGGPFSGMSLSEIPTKDLQTPPAEFPVLHSAFSLEVKFREYEAARADHSKRN